MPDLNRDVKYAPGPRFYRDHEGDVQFEHVVDGKNKIGPMPATDEHKAQHPRAYELFEKADADRHKHPEGKVLGDGSAEEPGGSGMVQEAGDIRQAAADPNYKGPEPASGDSDMGAFAGGVAHRQPKKGARKS